MLAFEVDLNTSCPLPGPEKPHFKNLDPNDGRGGSREGKERSILLEKASELPVVDVHVWSTSPFLLSPPHGVFHQYDLGGCR